MTNEPGYPAWIERGAAVAYYPHSCPAEAAGIFHVGIVDGPPRLVGGTWVVSLRDMEPTYRDAQRRTVPAAACHCLKPYDLTAEHARLRAEQVRLWAIDRREAILREGLEAVRAAAQSEAEDAEGTVLEIQRIADLALTSAAALSQALEVSA